MVLLEMMKLLLEGIVFEVAAKVGMIKFRLVASPASGLITIVGTFEPPSD